MKLKVIVQDTATGAQIYEQLVDTNRTRGTDQESLSPLDFALDYCSPQLCPFDCDRCRE